MDKKGRVTAKLIILDSLLFIFLLINIWTLVRILFLNAHVMQVILVFYSIPIFFILCILFFILGRHDMSAFDKLLPCIPTAAFIWLYLDQRDVVLLPSMIVGGLSCLALVILTVRKLVSTKSRVSQ
ncbi:hypothetical protein ES703_108636 [subsurface metagenome]